MFNFIKYKLMRELNSYIDIKKNVTKLLYT